MLVPSSVGYLADTLAPRYPQNRSTPLRNNLYIAISERRVERSANMEFPGSASGIDQIPQVSVAHASSFTDDGNVAPTLLLLRTVSKHEMGTKMEVEADVVDDAITAILPATPCELRRARGLRGWKAT